MRFGALKLVLTGLLFTILFVTNVAFARQAVAPLDQETIALSNLPRQGQDTYRLIHEGGPFPFEKDGVVFGNRERLLPQRKRGYYREYTVKTPKSRNRGALRIVCGGPAQTPDNCYYTADHYASFRRIVP
jgi:ribonuclease T1